MTDINLKQYPKTPMLKGFVEGKLIEVFCPYCNEWHTHGWDGDVSHREAHCHNKDSAFHEKGYFIGPFLKKDITVGHRLTHAK